MGVLILKSGGAAGVSGAAGANGEAIIRVEGNMKP